MIIYTPSGRPSRLTVQTVPLLEVVIFSYLSFMRKLIMYSLSDNLANKNSLTFRALINYLCRPF